MKHPLSVTAMLVGLFVAAQLVGLSLVLIDAHKTVDSAGRPQIAFGDTPIGARPDVHGAGSLVYIAVGVGVGTAVMLALIRFSAFRIWKVWFLIAVLLSLYVAFGVLLPAWIAFGLALVLAAWKVFRPNPLVHNFTELFVYAGIAVLIAPLFDLFWGIMLLLAISVYDAIAVWHSKHMVTLAQAQTRSNLFAGLAIPKSGGHVKDAHAIRAKGKGSGGKGAPASARAQAGDMPRGGADVAILGGGDIAFPLLFSSVVLVWLVNARGLMPVAALYETLIVTACATISLALLFAYSKHGKFYPAMPFISAGCLVGLGIVWLL